MSSGPKRKRKRVLVVAVALGVVAAGLLALYPSLSRARIAANEAAALGDLREIASAEVSYQVVNGGYFDTPACLTSPSGCLPGYKGASFLDPELASLQTRGGYRRAFHPGRAAPSEKIAEGKVSRSSLLSFSLSAVPDKHPTSGVVAFCINAQGHMCFTKDGSTPVDDRGECCGQCDMRWGVRPCR